VKATRHINPNKNKVIATRFILEFYLVYTGDLGFSNFSYPKPIDQVLLICLRRE
jgi:hypothetical protein